MAAYENIIVETQGRVGLIRLNRPAALNALCDALVREIGQQMQAFDADNVVCDIVITGNDRAFAAGADIKEMRDRTNPAAMVEDFIGAGWETVLRVKKPVIAAVAGFALGGGCDLAMICDMIFAADTAKFGQPEINLGVMPGAGGTQRLTRAVGKAVAMDMILSGRMLGAYEARDLGLVARVVAQEAWLDAAKRVAGEIAAKSPISVRLAKEAIDEAFETPLSAGIEFERRSFYLARASEDAGEGLSAFVEKRKPEFRGR